jgi:hypothetical protein
LSMKVTDAADAEHLLLLPSTEAIRILEKCLATLDPSRNSISSSGNITRDMNFYDYNTVPQAKGSRSSDLDGMAVVVDVSPQHAEELYRTVTRERTNSELVLQNNYKYVVDQDFDASSLNECRESILKEIQQLKHAEGLYQATEREKKEAAAHVQRTKEQLEAAVQAEKRVLLQAEQVKRTAREVNGAMQEKVYRETLKRSARDTGSLSSTIPALTDEEFEALEQEGVQAEQTVRDVVDQTRLDVQAAYQTLQSVLLEGEQATEREYSTEFQLEQARQRMLSCTNRVKDSLRRLEKESIQKENVLLEMERYHLLRKAESYQYEAEQAREQLLLAAAEDDEPRNE